MQTKIMVKITALCICLLAFWSCHGGQPEGDKNAKRLLTTSIPKKGGEQLASFRADASVAYIFPDNGFQQSYAVAVNKLKQSFKRGDNKRAVTARNTVMFKLDTSIHTTNKDYYTTTVTSTGITVKAPYPQGLLNAMTWIETQSRGNRGWITPQKVVDSAVIPVRVLHLVIWGGETLQYMKSMVDLARLHHFNTLILFVTNGLAIDGMKAAPQRKRMSASAFKELCLYARQSGLEVIPQMALLSHQNKLLATGYPKLLLNKTTYNPDNPQVYKVIFPMINEVLRLSGARTFHIGHDEVAGLTGYKNDAKAVGAGRRALSPQAFIKDVKKIDSFLSAKNVTPMMWGDMLLPKQQFAGMRQIVLHGDAGFGDLISQIPQNTIICDWHYFDVQKDFPSYKMLIDKGFTTYGATWKDFKTTKNFAVYVAHLAAPVSKKGMIATTWYGPKKKALIRQIIVQSGDIFWNAK